MAIRDQAADDEQERRRFAAMNDMLNPTSVGMLRLRGGERILDVGCGLGQLTRAMARAAGRSGKVVGISFSEDWLEEARRLAAQAGEPAVVDFRAGEPHEPPLGPEEWGHFDLVHGRFILERIRTPERVVESMVRAARPGGRIVLEDDDHAMIVIWPEPEGFHALWEGYVRWCERRDYDPFVGRRLVALLQGAGAEPVRSASLSVSSCAGSPSFKPLFGIVLSMFESTGEAMLAGRSIKKKQLETGLAGLRAWASLPEAALWYTTCWAEGRRPAGASGSG